MKLSAKQNVGACGIVMVAAVAAVTLQARQTAPDVGATLLEEVKAMRVELRDAAATSMRTQLLVARLSLQEQRITVLNRDLGEVQGQLTRATSERIDGETRVRELLKAQSSNLPPDVARDLEFEREALQTTLKHRQQTEQDLRLRESEILGAISGEQARWADFNARLDELERTLAAPGRR